VGMWTTGAPQGAAATRLTRPQNPAPTIRRGLPGPIWKILTHLGEPLEPPPVSPARGPPNDWGELVQIHDDRDVFQASPDELPAIDIHSL
jgi:hypothetical protein